MAPPGRMPSVIHMKSNGTTVRAAELLTPITIEHARTSRRRPQGAVVITGASSGITFAVDTSMRVSPAKAHAELGWRPAFPTYLDGIADMVNAARQASASAR